MHRIHVVTEGPMDEALLAFLLRRAASGRGVEIISRSGRGRSEAESLASSILAGLREPVVLVVDADSRDARRIEEQRRDFADLLGMHAPGSMWRVVLMVPEIEALLFRDPGLVREALDVELDERLLYRAKYEPRAVLKELLAEAGVSYQDLLMRLEEADLSVLLDAPEIRQIMDFSAAVGADEAERAAQA